MNNTTMTAPELNAKIQAFCVAVGGSPRFRSNDEFERPNHMSVGNFTTEPLSKEQNLVFEFKFLLHQRAVCHVRPGYFGWAGSSRRLICTLNFDKSIEELVADWNQKVVAKYVTLLKKAEDESNYREQARVQRVEMTKALLESLKDYIELKTGEFPLDLAWATSVSLTLPNGFRAVANAVSKEVKIYRYDSFTPEQMKKIVDFVASLDASPDYTRST